LDKHLAEVGWRTAQFKQRLREMAERITELEREKTAGKIGVKVFNKTPGSTLEGVRINMEKVRILVLNQRTFKISGSTIVFEICENC